MAPARCSSSSQSTASRWSRTACDTSRATPGHARNTSSLSSNTARAEPNAVTIARTLHIPETVIALTLVALGTSIPEVATSISAALKGHGELSAGNILGANIMNICWVAGASAMANPLPLTARQVFVMFPAMFVIVLAKLLMLRMGWRLTRVQGVILLVLYAGYLAASFLVFGAG